jgi:putative hemolysin
MAFVSISKKALLSELKDGRSEAGLLIKLRDSPERPLSVLQLGITLVGAISAAVGGAGAEEKIAPWLSSYFKIQEKYSEIISIIIVVIPITYATVLLGEIIPKTIAIKFPKAIAFASVKWIYFFDKLFSPIISFLEMSTKIFFKVFRIKRSEGSGKVHYQSARYILNLIDSEKTLASSVLLDVNNVQSINATDSIDVIMEKIISSGHTRLPVLNGEVKTEAIGVLHTKEFIVFFNSDSKNSVDWKTIIRPPVFVSALTPVLHILKSMQITKTHMFLVNSSEGQLLGIITLSDILEEIIGNIPDEDHDECVRRLSY